MKKVFILLSFLSFMTLSISAQDAAGVAEAVRGDTASSGWVASLLHWYDANMNYLAVGALMTIES